jgi:signal transduction histidine kinase
VHADKLATLGKMVAVLAHEINNPIQTIKNTLFLLDDQMDDSPYKQILEITQSETARITKLISNLRDAYRPRARELSSVNILDLLEEVEIILAPQMSKSKVLWEVSGAAQPYTVLANRDGAKQVFLNLGMNAIEALEEVAGGKITLTINASGDNNRCEVAMHNSGPLIPQDILQNIFEPFFSTKAGRGTGLGLSISQDIVREYGGEIIAESSVEHGVIFTVRFPLAGDILAEGGRTGYDAAKKHPDRG